MTLSNYIDIEMGNEEMLKVAIATVGPVSVNIQASRLGFIFYKSGIFYDKGCLQDSLDHGIHFSQIAQNVLFLFLFYLKAIYFQSEINRFVSSRLWN
jgi:hypothetical protein